MKGSVVLGKLLSAVCILLLAQGQSVLAQGGGSTEPTKTIIGDLLDVDRDFYIVRGERGEISNRSHAQDRDHGKNSNTAIGSRPWC